MVAKPWFGDHGDWSEEPRGEETNVMEVVTTLMAMMRSLMDLARKQHKLEAERERRGQEGHGTVWTDRSEAKENVWNQYDWNNDGGRWWPKEPA